MADQLELAAQYGSPVGTLCPELDTRDADLERGAAELLTTALIGGSTRSPESGWEEPLR